MLEDIEGALKQVKREIIGIFVMMIWFAILLCALFFSQSANAQMNNEAWGFKQQNRASIAALMQQVENSDSGRAVASTGLAGYDQLVCGSDGASSATGNSTCIIMNNSDGAIQIGQDAQGDQDAVNTETSTVNGISDVLESMDE